MTPGQDGWSPNRTRHDLTHKFQLCLTFSRERRGAGNEVNNWSCPCEEASVDIQVVGGPKNF